MNTRLKYILLFLTAATITYLSTKLWEMVPYGSFLNPASIAFSAALGVATFILFVKIFKPKDNFLDMIASFLAGI